jgi:hypothetical protein
LFKEVLFVFVIKEIEVGVRGGLFGSFWRYQKE